MPVDKDNFLRAEAELILDEARKARAERLKDVGAPIQLTGVALDLHIDGNVAWIAENAAVVRKLDLETGKTLQLFRGHTAPLTSIAFFRPNEDGKKFLISGSWDKTINVWDVESKRLLSTTEAHTDFVKSLLVVCPLRLLVSTSSDKLIRFWDLTSIEEGKPLTSAGSLSAHTRPVEALAACQLDGSSAVLYTADTMGVIKVWELRKEDGPNPRWRSTQKDELTYHRTKINEIFYGNGQLWSASSDETVQSRGDPPVASATDSTSRPMPPLVHPTAVRAVLPLSLSVLNEPYVLTGSGDIIRAYDVSSPDTPELLSETDAHWHDIIRLRLWMRRSAVESQPGKWMIEPWVVSASLDGTLRRWRLLELLKPSPKPPVEEQKKATSVPVSAQPVKESDLFAMTQDEERELAELMGNDD